MTNELIKLKYHLENNSLDVKSLEIDKYWSYVNVLDTKSQTFLCCTSS